MPSETCMTFVDLMEAQKFAISSNNHMQKLQDNGRNPRHCIDIDKLLERLRRKYHTQGPSFLYGSYPNLKDSTWEIFERDHRDYSSKQKEINNSMGVEIALNATTLRVEAKYRPKAAEKKDKTTFIILTGHRGMMPAVKCVLGCNIRVEIWGWKSGFAKAYLDLAVNNDLLSVYWLDSIFEDICFTMYRSTGKVKGVNDKTIMLNH
ncbi:hypothetical protein QBC47DRAFT_302617 [Echria macrotheca]|uniref:Uncharacterized protein n=1 Tax=Echria macrotheca TaxID=438768 RepID=A0AAJ0BCE6_9PEZI|nr:hypothetical protein QBC47DRAFT_302617 [Echria macrotheca]